MLLEWKEDLFLTLAFVLKTEWGRDEQTDQIPFRDLAWTQRGSDEESAAKQRQGTRQRDYHGKCLHYSRFIIYYLILLYFYYCFLLLLYL